MSSEKLLVVGPSGVALGLVLASAGILGAVYASQYWGGLAPCELCLYQRWPWWIVGGLGLLALWFVPSPRLWRFVIGFCGLTLMAGVALGVYHVGVEQHWWLGPASCTSSGTPASLEELTAQILAAPVVLCDQIRWSLFGITLAGFNAIASFIVATASLLAVWSSARREGS